MVSKEFMRNLVAGMIVMHPEKWEQAKTNPLLIGWFVGKSMQACDGKAKAEKFASMYIAELTLDIGDGHELCNL